MDQRIQYLKTEDAVNIAYTTFGHGSPLVVANGCWLSTAYDLDDEFGGRFYRAIAERTALPRRVMVYRSPSCSTASRRSANLRAASVAVFQTRNQIIRSHV